jgi:hypothetical protein
MSPSPDPNGPPTGAAPRPGHGDRPNSKQSFRIRAQANRDCVKMFLRPGIRETVSVSNEAIFAAARKFPETKAC